MSSLKTTNLDILFCIIDHLSEADKQVLRITCRYFHELLPPPIRAVAAASKYRYNLNVTSGIPDDALSVILKSGNPNAWVDDKSQVDFLKRLVRDMKGGETKTACPWCRRVVEFYDDDLMDRVNMRARKNWWRAQKESRRKEKLRRCVECDGIAERLMVKVEAASRITAPVATKHQFQLQKVPIKEICV